MESDNNIQPEMDPWGAVSAPTDNNNMNAVTATTNTDKAAEIEPSQSPWGAASNTVDNSPSLSDSMATMSSPKQEISNTLAEPFASAWLPLDDYVDVFISWLVSQFRPAFSSIKAPVDATLNAIDSLLNAVHPLLFIVLFALIAWQFAGRKLAIGSTLALFFIGMIGVWPQTMTTLSLVLTSVVFCMLIGLPTGIFMARSATAKSIIRPILDAMQTTPAFVYLVPIVMLFGIGNVPGVVVTIIFAVPPVIRLTSLGIEQVPVDLIEASQSFGASQRQLLFKVQLPLAMPTIMAGVNQTLMLALSMVVIASMISVGGLGLMVLRGIGRLDIGLATLGGIGIVVLAIILDRLTQAFAIDARARQTRHWYQTGPIGLLIMLTKKRG